MTMRCVICKKILNGSSYCLDQVQCELHLFHIRCHRTWQMTPPNEEQKCNTGDYKCPSCELRTCRPLLRRTVEKKFPMNGGIANDKDHGLKRINGENTRNIEEAIEAEVPILLSDNENGGGTRNSESSNEITINPYLRNQELEQTPVKNAPSQKYFLTCQFCFQVFGSTGLKSKHVDKVHRPKKVCSICSAEFGRTDNLNKHKKMFLDNDDHTYENTLKMFYIEHFHAFEEIRFVLEGSGYFDVRDENNHRIRIEIEVGDMVVMPAGICHRFTLDVKNYIKALRIFVGGPDSLHHHLPEDAHMKCREDFVRRVNFMMSQAA